jgi:hypothetical protein
MLSVLLLARCYVDAHSRSKDVGDLDAIELTATEVSSTAKRYSTLEITTRAEDSQSGGDAAYECNTRGQATPPPQYFDNDSGH